MEQHARHMAEEKPFIKARLTRERRKQTAKFTGIFIGAGLANEILQHEVRRKESSPVSHLVHTVVTPVLTGLAMETGETVIEKYFEEIIRCPQKIRDLGPAACPLATKALKMAAMFAVSTVVTAGLDRVAGPHHN